jgi:hypothetical protein
MARRVRAGQPLQVKNASGLKLSPEAAAEAKHDPIAMAAARFAPRTSDEFAQWSREKIGTWLTPQQLQIDESMLRNRYTAVPSCHASGKSRFAACKSGYFIDSHPLGSAFFVSTAPSSAQVEGVLWRELRRVHAAAGLRGRITRGGFPQWHVGEELVGFGRRPKEIASFQGVHAKFILIVIEEADGVPEELWTAVDTLTSSGVVRVLAIGNPDSSDSHFATVCRADSGWNVVRIDGLRSPNFTRQAVLAFPELYQYFLDNHIPFSDESVTGIPAYVRQQWRESLLSPEWVNERLRKWGVTRFLDEDGKPRWRESSLWQSKVRGMTPEEGAEGLIPLSWAERAMNRHDEWIAAGRPRAEGRLILGCDVADTGKDETVTTYRYGPIVEEMTRIGQQDTETTAERIKGRIHATPRSLAVVDANGIGVGVFNRLRRLNVRVHGFVGSQAVHGATDRTGELTFANKRSAAYWHVRELLDPVNGPDNLAIPRDPDLLADLTVPRWKIKTGAIIQVEPKEDVSKRLGRSPDCGDAVVMTFWPTSASGARALAAEYQTINVDEDWDPPVPAVIVTPAQRRAERLKGLVRRQPERSNVFHYAEASSGDMEWEDLLWP